MICYQTHNWMGWQGEDYRAVFTKKKCSDHLGMKHFSPPVFELISKEILMTPGHFSVFSKFPSENEKNT